MLGGVLPRCQRLPRARDVVFTVVHTATEKNLSETTRKEPRDGWRPIWGRSLGSLLLSGNAPRFLC